MRAVQIRNTWSVVVGLHRVLAMAQSREAEEVLDLCSEGDGAAERQSKRHRKDEFRQKQHNQALDLSSDPSQGSGEVGLRRGERRLWGEVEGPPRWSSARRRSSLRQAAAEQLQHEPATSSMYSSTWAGGLHFGRPGAEAPVPEQSGRGAYHPLPPYRPPPPYQPSQSCGRPVVISTDEASPRARARTDTAALGRLEERDALIARQAVEAAARELEAARRMQEEHMARRIDELEEMEAEAELARRRGRGWGAPPASRRPPRDPADRSRASSGRASGAWAPSLAEAMMGMFSENGPLSQMHSLSEHVAAVRQALGNIAVPGRLPTHLLFSDRDFDENDYEALLALDETVQSRKGASQEEIECIPTVVVGSGGARAEEECRCPICLEDLVPGALLRKMACKHQFHRNCLDRWLSHRAVCPICQQTLGS